MSVWRRAGILAAMQRDALSVLQHVFGYHDFRGEQRAIIDNLIDGDDALVLMPTGGGKSLCYQIPSLVRDGVGVVVSPLIALMQDQVSALNALGVRAAFLNSTLSAEQSQSLQQQVRNAIAEYEKMGAKVKEISLPNTHLSVPTYYVVAPAECSANLSRMDGVRFGYRCEDPKDIEDLYCRSRGEGFGNEVKRRIMVGAYALSAGFYDAYYKKAQQVRRLIKNDFVEAFKDVDVIMSPTSPTPAFKFGEKTDDPVAMYLEDIFTIATNLAGLPGMSVPCGQVNNLPVGLQLIGNYFDEARILNAGHKFQQATDWHLNAPQGIE